MKKDRSNSLEVWVSPEGDDGSPGSQQRPVRTLPAAVRLLRRQRRAAGGDAGGRIVLRGGRHFLQRPLVLDYRDSRREQVPAKERARSILESVEICSAPGEQAEISGGRRISGWRQARVHGVDAWCVTLPAVKRGTWYFTQLWVNGKRARRPRLPETGTYRIAERFEKPGPEDRFGFSEGDVRDFHNLPDVDFVALHFWIESRIPLLGVDAGTRVAHLAYPPRMGLSDSIEPRPAPYYLDNVYEALCQPGQWYLDRQSGVLTYIPRPGESMQDADVVAPVLDHLVRIEGDPGLGQYAHCITLRGLTFSHCEYFAPEEEREAIPQSACHVIGAVRMVHARSCALVDCTVEHVGTYGVEVTGDSADCEIRGCTIRDTSAGGVRIFQIPRDPAVRGRARYTGATPWHPLRRILVTDCHLHDGGHRWRQAVGVLIGNCSGIEVSHCHIHDYDYTGVSLGWTWGYEESGSYGNVIEWNHIHDIGRGTLSDMGGIYTLGQQPGTRIRYNHIHHVNSRGYGGWGIYPDEGSSDILIEYNLVHDTKCAPFHQHYGRNNIVRNNIFAFCREQGMVALTRMESHNAFTFERNIVLTDGQQITSDPFNAEGQPISGRFDHNIYYDVQGRRLTFGGRTWTVWRRNGQDRHSVHADPQFVDAAKRDFRLRPDAPVAAIGFVPFDFSGVGPRKVGSKQK